jgi:ABC-type branched-subunit amino acid transport system substrate-binding protein
MEGKGRKQLAIAVVCLTVACLTVACLTVAGVGSTPVGAASAKGQGVTDSTIKLGLVQVDYSCIKDFVDFNRGDQEETYQVFVDDLNAKGGINGRKVEAVYRDFCPIGNAQALSTCTSFTEDDKVFAVVGVFLDQSGDAQLCIAKNHETVEIIHNVSQAWINQAPKGLLLTPNITTDRRLSVILDLLGRDKTLKGKKVAALTQADSKDRVESVVKPALKKMKVQQGTTGLLSITGTDTTAAQSQLDAFIEKWKAEDVDTFVLVGQVVVAKPYVTKLKEAFPDATLISDQTPVALSGGQDEVAAGIDPNPYEGIISAEGESEQTRFETPVVRQCVKTYEKATGEKVVAPEDLKPGPDGKRVEVYQSIEDACGELLFFAKIAEKAGKTLNNSTWKKAVESMGRMDDQLVLGQWASLHKGKYDANDTFGLVEFDSASGRTGDWKALTPVENVSGEGQPS